MNLIKNDNLKVSYSEGYVDKAKLQFNRIKSMQDFYKKKKDIVIKTEVKIIDKASWQRDYNELPYGLPFVILADTPIVILPATDDGIIVQNSLIYSDRVPKQTSDILVDINCTFDEAVKTFTDLIGFHEIGHTLTNEFGVKKLNMWFNEFMATYFAFSYMVENEPRLAKIWQANSYVTYLDGSKPEYTSMIDFDEQYFNIPPANYDWYQKQFALLVSKVYAEQGLSFIDKVKQAFNNDEVDSEEAFSRLKDISPLFTEWENRLKRKFE